MTTILSTLASTYPSSRSSDLSFLSINAEEIPEISETYDVTAVPFTVIVRDGKVLESLSGSDATKVRTAAEKYAGTGATPATANGSASIPPALKAEPQKQSTPEQPNGVNRPGTKDLSGYAPKDSDPQTAPAYSGGAEQREELNDRLSKLVKAA
jgi:thioredoxin-like negative regulator of GroEL